MHLVPALPTEISLVPVAAAAVRYGTGGYRVSCSLVGVAHARAGDSTVQCEFGDNANHQAVFPSITSQDTVILPPTVSDCLLPAYLLLASLAC